MAAPYAVLKRSFAAETPLTEFARWQPRSPHVNSDSRFRLPDLLLFHDAFEIREIAPRRFGERC
jgi:hypothetical protein